MSPESKSRPLRPPIPIHAPAISPQIAEARQVAQPAWMEIESSGLRVPATGAEYSAMFEQILAKLAPAHADA